MITWLKTNFSNLFVALSAIAMMLGFNACVYDQGGALVTGSPEAIYNIMNGSPFTSITENDRRIQYFDIRDRLIAYHGKACFDASNGASRRHIGHRVLDGIELIDRFDDEATVFLNGWEVSYNGKRDQNVLGMGISLLNIRRQNDSLFWEVWATLGDIRGDDDIKVCYNYTVLMWEHQPHGIEAVPMHSDANGSQLFIESMPGTVLAHRFIPGMLEDDLSAPRAALPRGFGVGYDNESANQLYLFGFDYGNTITLFPNGTRNGDGSGIMTWSSEVVFQNNNFLPIRAASLVSGLSGRSVAVQQNDIPLRPRRPSGCLGGQVTKLDRTVKVEVPFEHAIPMLTGWQLGNSCNDTQLKRIGIGIDSFSMDRNRSTGINTLTYRVIGYFHDDGPSQALSIQDFKVNILGFNSLDSDALQGGTSPTDGRLRPRNR